FGKPDSAGIRGINELIADPPAAVSTFNHVNPTRRIAAIRIIISGEQIAELIECEFLRIAETPRKNLQIAAIGIATKHGAHFGFFHNIRAVLHVEPAIADTEIEPSIRPEPQAV